MTKWILMQKLPCCLCYGSFSRPHLPCVPALQELVPRWQWQNNSLPLTVLPSTRLSLHLDSYWEGHNDISIPSCSPINWTPSAAAINCLSLGKKSVHWKFFTRCIAVGNQLHHCCFQDHGRVPDPGLFTQWPI